MCIAEVGGLTMERGLRNSESGVATTTITSAANTAA